MLDFNHALTLEAKVVRQETHDGTRPGKQNASEPNPARSHKTRWVWIPYYKNEGKVRDDSTEQGNEGTEESHAYLRSHEWR